MQHAGNTSRRITNPAQQRRNQITGDKIASGTKLPPFPRKWTAVYSPCGLTS
jgi:hypothetical protein